MCSETEESKNILEGEPRIIFLDADNRRLEEHPPLCENEVHLWRAWLNQEDYHREMEMLSEKERIQAERFYFEKDRRSFIMTHAMLRKIVGSYLKIDPHDVKFICGTYGKPSIDGNHNEICFNMSDSFELAIFAFAQARQVGVDIEYIRPMHDAQDIVLNFFSPGEKMAIDEVEEKQRLEAFFKYWTRKEAYLKAIGKGLMQPMDSFEASLNRDFIWVRDNPQEVYKWSVRSFNPAPGYVGALVFEKKSS
ncbi:4'-phosphopantetheinyl transferase superfamily protein [Candidatus Aerophobetes bacterium]|nr:4'-phosphopantetheinyl transferase superfamily protein [Candidatus Aerophobetes bacterium]